MTSVFFYILYSSWDIFFTLHLWRCEKSFGHYFVCLLSNTLCCIALGVKLFLSKELVVFLFGVYLITYIVSYQNDEPVEETPATKPIVGIIYPPPEVRNIVDKTASFVARFDTPDNVVQSYILNV